jgi:hypothetical protein
MDEALTSITGSSVEHGDDDPSVAVEALHLSHLLLRQQLFFVEEQRFKKSSKKARQHLSYLLLS